MIICDLIIFYIPSAPAVLGVDAEYASSGNDNVSEILGFYDFVLIWSLKALGQLTKRPLLHAQ